MQHAADGCPESASHAGEECWFVTHSTGRAPVAQLDRAPGFEPVGRGFKSLRAHHRSVVLSEGDVAVEGPVSTRP